MGRITQLADRPTRRERSGRNSRARLVNYCPSPNHANQVFSVMPSPGTSRRSMNWRFCPLSFTKTLTEIQNRDSLTEARLGDGFREMLIGYVRVSSSDERQNTDLQRDAMAKAGVDERHLFEDKASGARADRPELKKCLDYLTEGDVLIVWKLDRLGRSLSHLMQIIKELRERKIGFRSLTESIDTTTPMGELMFHIFGALAQYERSLIQERINAGLEAARRRGRRGGRPRRVDDATLEVAKSLLADPARTVSGVAKAISVPRSTLVDSLKRVTADG